MPKFRASVTVAVYLRDEPYEGLDTDLRNAARRMGDLEGEPVFSEPVREETGDIIVGMRVTVLTVLPEGALRDMLIDRVREEVSPPLREVRVTFRSFEQVAD
jgi:hypothetical protein